MEKNPSDLYAKEYLKRMLKICDGLPKEILDGIKDAFEFRFVLDDETDLGMCVNGRSFFR